MTDLVDQMFPPVHRKWAAEFTDFNYWKDPIPEFDLPDLSPPSPALSAVSDTSGGSRLSRLRNFGFRATPSQTSLKGAANAITAVNKFKNGSRAGLSTSPLMASPLTAGDLDTFDDGEASDDEDHPRRSRTRSFDSMPGSLPDMNLDDYTDEEYSHSEEEADRLRDGVEGDLQFTGNHSEGELEEGEEDEEEEDEEDNDQDLGFDEEYLDVVGRVPF